MRSICCIFQQRPSQAKLILCGVKPTSLLGVRAKKQLSECYRRFATLFAVVFHNDVRFVDVLSLLMRALAMRTCPIVTLFGILNVGNFYHQLQLS